MKSSHAVTDLLLHYRSCPTCQKAGLNESSEFCDAADALLDRALSDDPLLVEALMAMPRCEMAPQKVVVEKSFAV